MSPLTSMKKCNRARSDQCKAASSTRHGASQSEARDPAPTVMNCRINVPRVRLLDQSTKSTNTVRLTQSNVMNQEKQYAK